MILNPEERAILTTQLAGMSTKKALLHLQERGIQLSEGEYNKRINKMNGEAPTRLNRYGIDFPTNHLASVEKLEAFELGLFELLDAKKEVIRVIKSGDEYVIKKILVMQDPLERAKIYRELRDLQPYLSAYREQAKNFITGSPMVESHEMMGERLRNETNNGLSNPRK